MIPEIANYIGDLLYEHDAVIVPQLGGFVTSYKSASIDHVQGLLYPPSKIIAFNENLVINDGVLINHLRQRHGLSSIDARQAVETFVANVRAAIEKREIVVFPEVGRLYQDYEQNIQFLPDSTNYNTDVFGLPTVQFYPILRTYERNPQEIEEKPKTQKVPQFTIDRQKRRRRALFRAATPYMIAGLVILGALGIYNSLRNGSTLPTATEFRLPASHNFNVPPSRPEFEEELATIDEDEADAMNEAAIIAEELKEIDAKTIIPNKTKPKSKPNTTTKNNNTTAANDRNAVDEEDIDTEAATLLPSQKIATIIVHSFGNKDNVRRMTKKLIKKGYNVVTDSRNGLTRVGVKIVYEKSSELDKKLRKIRRHFNKGAFVK